MCSRVEKEVPSKSVIMKLLLSTIGERDYSAQEVSHVLMGLPLYKCSRSFVKINIHDENWKKLEVSMCFTIHQMVLKLENVIVIVIERREILWQEYNREIH